MKNLPKVVICILALSGVSLAKVAKSNNVNVYKNKELLLTKIAVETGKLNYIEDSITLMKKKWNKEANESMIALHQALLVDLKMMRDETNKFSDVGFEVDISECRDFGHALEETTMRTITDAVKCYKSKLAIECAQVQKILDRVYELLDKYTKLKEEACVCEGLAVDIKGKVLAYECIANIYKNSVLKDYSKQVNGLLKELEKILDQPSVKPKLYECGSPCNLTKPLKEQITVSMQEFIMCIITKQRDHINSKKHC